MKDASRHPNTAKDMDQGFCAEAVPTAHLDLPWADVELLQDVDEEVLDLHPGVDAVGAIQDNDDVHVGLAPWEGGT